MKLDIAERILILNLLPAKGNFVTLTILDNLRKELSFSEAEIKKAKIVTNSDAISWSKNLDKEVSMGETAQEIVSKELKKLDETEELTSNLLGLYKRFVNAKEET